MFLKKYVLKTYNLFEIWFKYARTCLIQKNKNHGKEVEEKQI